MRLDAEDEAQIAATGRLALQPQRLPVFDARRDLDRQLPAIDLDVNRTALDGHLKRNGDLALDFLGRLSPPAARTARALAEQIAQVSGGSSAAEELAEEL